MKKIEAYLTFDDKLFKTEHEAKEHEKSFIEGIKATASNIQKICKMHNCSFCPLSIKTVDDVHCPLQDLEDTFCAPEDWTLNFPAE